MIKNIVLDMGNVLLDYNPDIPLQRFAETKKDRELLRREVFEAEEWIWRDLGQISCEEQYRRVSARVPGRLHEALRKCIYEWTVCMTPIPEAQEFCAWARREGYGLYVLSNASEQFYDYFPRFAPPDFFDGIVISAELHKIKPDPEIYLYLLERYALAPEECLFIDDRVENVAAAVAVGMSGAVYRGDFASIRKNYIGA